MKILGYEFKVTKAEPTVGPSRIKRTAGKAARATSEGFFKTASALNRKARQWEDRSV